MAADAIDLEGRRLMATFFEDASAALTLMRRLHRVFGSTITLGLDAGSVLWSVHFDGRTVRDGNLLAALTRVKDDLIARADMAGNVALADRLRKWS